MPYRLFVSVLMAALVCATSAGAQTCVGDCNGDGEVTINELITGVNIALGSAAVTACPAMDRNSNGGVSIDELVAAVSSALNGCPAMPPTATAPPANTNSPSQTPTSTATASSTTTATATATPTSQPPSLDVQVNPDRVAPGETAMIGLTVTNRGLALMNGVALRAVLPAAGITGTDRGSISDGGSCNNFGCAPGAAATWSLGTLAPGEGRTVSLPITVATGASAPADLSDLVVAVTATATGTAATGGEAIVVVDRNRTLTLAIAGDRHPAVAGETLRYRLTYANRGVAPVADATLSIAVPLATSFVSASDGATPDVAGVVEWPLGNLAAGASGVRELLVTLDPNGSETVAAEAALRGGGSETIAQDVTRVAAPSPLTVRLAAGPDPVAPGEAVLATLTVSNAGNAPLDDVVASLRVPPGVAAIETAAASGATCNLGASFGCDALERARWTVGDLAPGQSVTYSVPATVLTGQGAPAPGSVLVLEADALAADGTEAEARRAVALRAARPLDVEIDATPYPALAAGEMRYVVSFGNRGVTLLAGGVLSMPLPEGTAFVSASHAGAVANGAVSWQLGDLAVGAGGVRELIVSVASPAAAGAPIAAEATIIAGDARAQAEAITPVEDAAPLQIALVVGPDPVTPREALQAALTVTNRGLLEIFDLAAVLRVPAEVSSFATNMTTGGVVCNAGTTFGCDPLERASWTIGALPPGQSATLTFPAAVPTGQGAAPAGAVISFDAEVKSNSGARAQTRRSVLLRATRGAELELDAERQEVAAGDVLRYRLTYGNRGVTELGDADIELPLPAGTTFESASDGGTVDDGVVRWALGDLAPGATGFRELVLVSDAAAPQGTQIAASAVLRSGADEAHAAALARVRDLGPLAVAITAGPDPLGPGEAMTTWVTVSNQGPVSLFDVRAGLRVPPETAAWAPNLSSPTSTCSAAASFGCDPLERQVWSLGELRPGQSVTLSVPPVLTTGQNAAPAGSLVSFEADAEANDGSQVLARTTLARRAARPLELEIAQQPGPVDPGESVTYQLTFGNRAGASAVGAELSLRIPDGMTFESASDGGMQVGDRVVWPLGDCATGSHGVREATLGIDPAVAEGRLEHVRAELLCGDVQSAEVWSPIFPVPLSLDIDLAPDPVSAGQSLVLSVTATNNGLVNLFGISASVRVPPELPSFAANLTGGGNCSRASTFGCDPLETVIWSLGTPTGLAPGESVTVSIPPVVPMGATAPPPGTLIGFEVDVRANDGSQVTARPVVAVE